MGYQISSGYIPPATKKHYPSPSQIEYLVVKMGPLSFQPAFLLPEEKKDIQVGFLHPNQSSKDICRVWICHVVYLPLDQMTCHISGLMDPGSDGVLGFLCCLGCCLCPIKKIPKILQSI